ncbi:hypothetical protein C0J52_21294 [Blattella germanica]|nr:hypothetical protein C0J52_21294 [Blattella germanica]
MNDKAVQTEVEEKTETITAKDLTTEEPPSEVYWKILAERRRVALDETLKENLVLHEKLELLEQEKETIRKITFWKLRLGLAVLVPASHPLVFVNDCKEWKFTFPIVLDSIVGITFDVALVLGGLCTSASVSPYIIYNNSSCISTSEVIAEEEDDDNGGEGSSQD